MLTRSPVPARSPSASPSSFHTTHTTHAHFQYNATPSSPPKRRSPKPPTAVSRRPSSTTSSPLGLNPTKAAQRSPSTTTATTTTTARPAAGPSFITTIPSSSSSSSFYSSSAAPPQSTPARPATYVAVDAATQYSPMEPHDYFAPPKPSPLQNAAPAEASSSSYPSTSRTARPLQQQEQRHQHTQSTAAYPPIPPAAALAVAGTAEAPEAGEEPPMLKAPHPLSPNKRRNSQGPALEDGDAAAGSGAGSAGKRAKPEVAPPKVLPVRYELCAIEDVVVLIANMLAELIETNDGLALRSGHLTRFHSRTAPGISVLDYLHRLAKHATLTPPLLLSMVYYIDRLCALYPDFTINTLTVHRFLITAATVAAKGLSDSFWNNSTYARVGGVRVAELKLLELEFLERVDWKIVPDPDVLVAYYRGLVQRSPAYVLEDELEDEEIEDEMEDAETEISDEEEEDDEDEAAAPVDGSETETSAQGKPPDNTAEL